MLSAEDAQEGFRREVAQLGRRFAILHDELAKDREFKGKRYEELQKKCSDLEERVTGQGKLRDLLTAVEEKYKKILQENNEAIAVWLQAALDGLKEAGTTTEYKSASWNDHIEGDNLEDQGLLLGAQSDAFDFVK